ncbi:probable serine/threonine-protein kinase At1g54610 [Impatiens glandulifera]|uniref:probable serine/threonine-protein kinase At1g54610 n=1 Tax=Impatiens glandulifera TaxID=253017 RepID=UPI001FB1A0E8|nr:probable serine/threonine-protein kinase At1g54610 [Impatiens glandulifera]
MGCFLSKDAPIKMVEKPKQQSRQGSVSTAANDPKRKAARQDDTCGVTTVGGGVSTSTVSHRNSGKKINAEEMINGWPKWLIDNVPKKVLAGLVPKTADSYDKLSKVGQGTYSNVYKARDRDTGKIVAMKKVRFDTTEPESIKFMAREIRILRDLDHPNIIKLEGIATSRMQYSLYLVFDFMQSDLSRLILRSPQQQQQLTEPQVKTYMQQLLSGLQHCHERGILHRDIKGSNLLIDKNGMLKIADFGLANYYDQSSKQRRPLTSRVVTLWYRAPELLLGSTDYGVAIDLWSAGCILAEMFIGRPIMPGRTEVEQLHRIFKLCGSPTEDYWKRMKPPTTFRPAQYKPSYRETFESLPSSSFGLITTLLSLDPSYRGTAASALKNTFFTSIPLPCKLTGLPQPIKDKDDRRNLKVRQKTLRDQERSNKRKVSFNAEKKELENSEMNNNNDNNNNSSSSVRKQSKSDQGGSPAPLLTTREVVNRTARTEAHPNAMKNIKNFPILMASMADTASHITIENNRLTLKTRSFSHIDFRTVDVEKMSKLFGGEEH